MTKRKRPTLALDVWRHVVSDFPGARLSMVGDGPEMGKVARIASELPSGAVTLLGNVPNLLPILLAGQVMFHTSAAEGIPKNIRYAMNFGIPVVSTRVGAIHEAVSDGENGFLAQVDDADGLVLALGRFLRDPALRIKMGMAGRQRGAQLFDIEHMIDNVSRAYKELCGVDLDPQPPAEPKSPAWCD